MEKFKYAPGLPGYGTKGVDGSSGLTGLSMYFTNLNGIDDHILIKNNILANNILWTAVATPLPNNRTYQTGDLFVDTLGKVYEIKIDNSYPDRFIYTGAYLNTSSIFVSHDVNDEGILRYSNQYIETHNIVDSVYSLNVTDYTQYPTTIYGIEPINFERIEYSDIAPQLGEYNPFTLFTSGTNDSNSIALVRDVNSNQFRLGNLNSDGSIRNVNLIFDVSELRVSKNSVGIDGNIESGKVLTDYEIFAPNLMNKTFNKDAASFTWKIGAANTDVSIYWNLVDIAGTTDMASIAADIYVYKDLPIAATKYTFPTLSFDTSIMAFHDIASSGVLGIGGLTVGETYHTYIKVIQNGWERETTRMSLYPGITVSMDASLGGNNVDVSVLFQNLNPTIINCASAGGVFILDISANVDCIVSAGDSWIIPNKTVFSLSDVDRPDWTAPHDSSVTIKSYTVLDGERGTTLTITGSTVSREIYVHQDGPSSPTKIVKLTASWSGTGGGSNGYIGYIKLERYNTDTFNWEDTLSTGYISPNMHPIYTTNRLTSSITGEYPPGIDGSINAKYNATYGTKYRYNAAAIGVIDSAGNVRYQTWGGDLTGTGQYSNEFTLLSSNVSATVSFHGEAT